MCVLVCTLLDSDRLTQPLIYFCVAFRFPEIILLDFSHWGQRFNCLAISPRFSDILKIIFMQKKSLFSSVCICVCKGM